MVDDPGERPRWPDAGWGWKPTCSCANELLALVRERRQSLQHLAACEQQLQLLSFTDGPRHLQAASEPGRYRTTKCSATFNATKAARIHQIAYVPRRNGRQHSY